MATKWWERCLNEDAKKGTTRNRGVLLEISGEPGKKFLLSATETGRPGAVASILSECDAAESEGT